MNHLASECLISVIQRGKTNQIKTIQKFERKTGYRMKERTNLNPEIKPAGVEIF